MASIVSDNKTTLLMIQSSITTSMAFKSFNLLPFFLLLGIIISADSIVVDEADALKHFKSSITDDPTGALLDWNADSTRHCNWTGIQCHDLTKRVISISIQQTQLKGTISPFLGNLSTLQILDLSYKDQLLAHNTIITTSMTFKSLIILPFLLLLGVLSAASIFEDEADALKHFKSSVTDDPTGALLDWNADSTHHCNWTGIQCHNITKQVISISIQQTQLKGQISPFLGNLSSLQILDLSYNSFTGSIPFQLGYCTQLSGLSLYTNSLSGPIPSELGNLYNLQILDVGNNSITGIIPDSLCDCTSLLELHLDSNKLNGTIPDRIDDLVSLQVLGAFNNLLEGSIPTSICNLKELQGLGLDTNKLNGRIPDRIGELANLQFFSAYNNLLEGSIPTSISNLKELQTLALYENQLSGIIPKDIGNLASLQDLLLYKNSFSGKLPTSMGRMKKLQNLDISQNQLFGIIPREIGNLSRLQTLQLFENSLSGNIPTEIGQFRNLTNLNLYSNKLTGSIPAEIGNLQVLWFLRLYDNQLDSTIPSSLFRLKSLTVLQLSRNNLTGNVSSNISSLESLQTLSLNDNKLSGEIPASITRLVNLTTLSISFNFLTGLIPSGIGSLYKLRKLSLNNNFLEGSIPQEIGNLTTLMLLNLGTNRLSGTLPVEISKMSFLQTLFLGNNNLEGQIPDKIFELKQLTELYLMNNKFEGSILNSVSKLEMLSKLDLSGNKFNGSIESNITKLNQLILIDLSHNFFTGSIPGPVISSMKNMQIYLNFSNNFFTRDIPNEFGKMEMVQAIDISNNNLSGGIPLTIKNCRNLQSLDLSGNQLSGSVSDEIFPTLDILSYINFSRNQLDGKIPESMANLTSLTSIDLSQKKFKGVIPENFGNNLALIHLNLSFNHLEGHVPNTGIFRNSSAIGLLGNPSLCNDTKSCSFSSQSNHSHKLFRKAVLTIAISGSLVLPLLLFLGIFCYLRVRKPKVKESEPEYIRGATLKRFDRKELEDATDGFNERNILGTSSLSTVYKGTLANGKMIAVKNLNIIDYSAESDKSFNKEMNTLAKLRHRNLVKVLGYAWESGKLKVVVLEYMENGNLDSVIHDSRIDRSRWNLSERIDVLVSVSRGLVYLHSGYDFPIVHCDLKPSNILLDEKWDAHVSDFGTARILGVHQQDGSSVSSASTFQGTIGYMAPEFAYMRKVTTKVDVFSFGIIMMELMTRKRPTGLTEEDDEEGTQITLPQLIDRAVSNGINELIEIVDPDLASDFSAIHGVVEQILQLALCCTRTDPNDRPDMNEIVSSLTKISKIGVN